MKQTRPRPSGLRRATLAGLALAASALPSLAAAMTVYKWTDDQGGTHYSDTPPEGREYEKLQIEVTGTLPAPDQEQNKEKKAEEAPTATDVNLTQAEIQVQKLEKRVQHAREVYQQARKNRVEGEKTRLGSERNYVRYLERVEKLKEQEQAAKEKLEELRGKLEEARTRLDELREKQAEQGQGG